MAYYLIDYENKKDLGDLSLLTKEDTIIFFYSDKADSMTFALHQKITSSPAEKIYFHAGTGGKNALDFQLSSYLGLLIGEHPEESFIILSADKGYDTLLAFWQGNRPSVKLTRLTKISVTVEQKDTPTEAPVSTDTENLRAALKGAKISFSDEQIETILQVFSKFKTKSAINNKLQKHFSNEEVKEINKIMKPFLKGKR